MQKPLRVKKAHRSGFTDPLIARQGDQLSFERRDTEWPGWIWCIAPSGKSGWVPESWVELGPESRVDLGPETREELGSGYCTLKRDYAATELSVEEGTTVTVELIESDWAWATTETGDSGWLPLSHLAGAYQLSLDEQTRMLRKLILYWDGQWFLKVVETFGLEAAIDLNARVRASFGRIEMRTLLKTVKKPKADDLADALRLLETYSDTFMGSRLRAEFAALSDHHAEVIVRRCAAYEGAKRAALPRADQACVACENLWDVWLETLLPDVPVEIAYPMRQGKGDAHCQFTIRIPGGKTKT
jgi:hypothetical protein